MKLFCDEAELYVNDDSICHSYQSEKIFMIETNSSAVNITFHRKTNIDIFANALEVTLAPFFWIGNNQCWGQDKLNCTRNYCIDSNILCEGVIYCPLGKQEDQSLHCARFQDQNQGIYCFLSSSLSLKYQLKLKLLCNGFCRCFIDAHNIIYLPYSINIYVVKLFSSAFLEECQ